MIIFRVLFGALKWLAVLCLVAYTAAALYFCAPLSPEMRNILTGVVLVCTLAPLLIARTWKKRLMFAGPVLVLVLGWYLSVPPKMDAPWGKDVAVLPDADVQGDTLTVRHIRNFNYRSDADFDVAYYDKTFDLSQLKTVDLFLSYWGTTAIAHTIMSFGFANGDQLPISIETRKEIGEEYSAVQGFFNKYELFYVVADERDVIGVRVNQRNEDVYLYRLKLTPVEARKLLLDYVTTIDKLERKPRFYNALVTNCTTGIVAHIKTFRKVDFSWELIVNGYIDKWRYEQGIWGFDLPFPEFRRRSNINDKVRQFVGASDFSARIREGLPSIKGPAV